MEKKIFGYLTDGQPVHLYTLDNGKLQACVLDYGCTVQSLCFDGVDFVCGFDSMEGYLTDDSWQGAFIGRVANRTGGAGFTLNGKTYQLSKNDGNNHLHGAFGKLVWEVAAVSDTAIRFTHRSPAEEEGYPGNMDVTVTYRLDDTAIVMEYTAVCDEDTPASFTNHAYFNLGGIDSGSVLPHELKIDADRVTLLDGEMIPTGERMEVAGTAYDFRSFHTIGERIEETECGYDNNFVLNHSEPVTVSGIPLFRAATLRSALYTMDCYTDNPGLQVYTGNFLGSQATFKYGVKPTRQHAVCLETQYEPDAVNRGEGILPAGKTYHHTTVYKLARR